MKKTSVLFIAFLLSTLFLTAQTFTNSTGGPVASGPEVCFPVTVSGVGVIDGTHGLASVCLSLTHTFDADIEIRLKAPDGTYVPLSIQNGGGGDNYTNTCFTMTAVTPIASGTAPFTGSFLPSGNLGSVNNNQNADGVWNICVKDITGAEPTLANLQNYTLTFNNSPAPPIPPSPVFSFSCYRDTTLTCAQTCITLNAKIPDIRASSNSYVVNPMSGPGGCFRPYVGADVPGNPTSLTIDDRYSSVINLPFTFPLFGVNYNSLIASTNGFVSFDVSKTGTFSHYSILNSGGTLSASTGTGENLPSALYDKALIMGPYHDLDPGSGTNPPADMLIKYDVLGAAPHRKWILSFYHVPLYSASCNSLNQNTHQIVLYEATGIVEVFINTKQICTGWNQGHAMIGMQDETRTKGIMAPGRFATDAPWGSIGMNESWRFTPATGATLYKNVKLYNTAGVLIATGDTASLGNGVLGVTFPNVCTDSTTKYIIKTTYSQYNDLSQEVYSTDTINVIKVLSATPVTATVTDAPCGVGTTGTITVTAPVGPTYQYSSNGGTLQTSPVFNLPPGTYTITAVSSASSCSSSKSVTINTITTLTATATSTPASCPGAANGTITVNATLGTPGYTYSIDGGLYVGGNVFTGVAGGTHTINVKDNALCIFSFTVTVNNGAGISATATTVNAACSGSATGSITIIPGAIAATPIKYSSATINGGAVQSGATFGTLAAGSYSILVEDANGCKTTVVATVANNAGITATATTVNAACSGSATGSITVTPGATAVTPIKYSCTVINSGTVQSSPVFSNIASGTYTILVEDANNCNTTVVATVNNNPGITATSTTTNAACSGSATGSITVIPTAGTPPPVTYSSPTINGGIPQSSPLFQQLSAGTYTVLVKAGNGCDVTITPTVSNNPGITATSTTTNAACSGSLTGSATIIPGAAAVAPVKYSCATINGGAVQNSPVFLNLAAGLYTFSVVDSNGCSTTVTATVSNNPNITATAGSTPTSCLAATNGTITATAGASATLPVKFSSPTINGGAVSLTGFFTNLPAAAYSVLVVDSNGCTVTVPVTVSSSAGITATAVTTNAACSGSATGKITVIPGSNAVAPIQYASATINGGASQPSPVFTNLASGTYSIAVTDSNGCSTTVNATVNNNPGITATAVVTNAACIGSSIGTITVIPASGIAPYTYSLSLGATFLGTQTTNQFDSLPAGVYTILVKDSNNCDYTFNATVGNNPGVSATAVTINSACAVASTGKIIVNPANGLLPYSYSLNSGAFQLSNTFTNLASGTYTIRVKDFAGCYTDITATVNNNPGVIATASGQNSSCATIPNGKVTVAVTAGVAPFSYSSSSINGGLPQSSNVFSGLLIGNYTIVIIDSAGCSNSVSATVSNDPKVQVTSFGVTDPSCNGYFNGELQVNAALGATPYQYSIGTGAFQTSNILTNIGAGLQQIHVKDNFGCILDTFVLFNEPAILLATASVTPASCTGNADGSISTIATGGTIPYQYTIETTGNTGYQNGAVFSVTASSYFVTVKDAKGCKASVPVSVSLLDTMRLELGADTSVCEGATIILKPNTNSLTNSFDWTPGTALTDSTIKNPGASPTSPIRYYLTAHWGVCTRTDSILVNVLTKPVPHAAADTIVCFRDTAYLYGSATNASGPVNYLWTPSGGLATPNQATTTAMTNMPKRYFLTVTDNYGCNFSATDTMWVEMKPPVPAYAGRDTTAVTGVKQQMFPASGGVSYEWSWIPNNALVPYPNMPNPVVTLQDFNYVFIVKVTDSLGCIGYDSVNIIVINTPGFYTPNAFSPNNDGLNDRFTPTPVGIVKTDWFRVYNRFGQLIFETNKFKDGWDGTFKGDIQPSATYVWMIQGQDINGNKVMKKGTVVLVK